MVLEKVGDINWPKRLKPEVQPDESTCGIISVGLLLKSRGISVPFEELVAILGNTWWGTEIANIENYLQAPHLRQHFVVSRNNTLHDMTRELSQGKIVMFDAQAHWGTKADKADMSAGHYAVAYAIDQRKRLRIFDSGCYGGHRKYDGLNAFPASELDELWIDSNLQNQIVRGWMATTR